MENECEALPGVAYPGVQDNRSTVNTKTGYNDDDDNCRFSIPSAMLSEIFMQINRILTKLRQLKLMDPVIMPHRLYMMLYMI